MALVVESTSTVSASNADNVVITKPTGVAVGDLLVIVASGYQSNLPTVSGFTAAISHTASVASTIASIALLYRIADASDVSASNYTVALAGSATSSGIASMFRISGWPSGNPVFSFEVASGEGDPVTTSGASGLTMPRPSAQILIIGNLFQSTSGGLSSATFSSYTVTSADSNPTWTELQDTQVAIIGSAVNLAMSVAYTNSSNTSTITAYSTAVSSDTTGNPDAIISFVAALCEPANATSDISHIQNDATIFGPTVTQVNVNPDIHHLDTDPDVYGLDARATAPTQWTNESKPSTTWTNET